MGHETSALACYVDFVSQIGDPVGNELLRRVAPFHIAEAMRAHLSSARCSRALSVLADLGLGNGLVIPLVSRRNLLYSLALFASDPDDKALTVPGRHTHEALVLATHFHQIARDLIDGAGGTRPSQLTPRERECLLWAACGKTAWETAHILNISERTVKFHLGNANRRLDTSNTTHAVARAIVRGEFLP